MRLKIRPSILVCAANARVPRRAGAAVTQEVAAAQVQARGVGAGSPRGAGQSACAVFRAQGG